MKAAQIKQYSKNIHITVNDIPIPETGDSGKWLCRLRNR